MRTRLHVEVAELRVPVDVLAAPECLRVGLQAEALLPQQIRDGVRAFLVPARVSSLASARQSDDVFGQ